MPRNMRLSWRLCWLLGRRGTDQDRPVWTQVLDALWAGWGAPGVGPAARSAAAAAFQDVLCWSVVQAPEVRSDAAVLLA